MGRSQRQVEVADNRLVDELDAGPVDLDVGGGPPDTNSSLRVDSSPIRSERRRSQGWTPASALSKATVFLPNFFHAIDMRTGSTQTV
jgi:hypothetical protein